MKGKKYENMAAPLVKDDVKGYKKGDGQSPKVQEGRNC